MTTSETTNPEAEEAPRGRGRPEFEPTEEDRTKAEILAAAGWNEIEIAKALKITPPTLRKHMGDDLAVGRAQKRAAMVLAMYNSGIAGNVSAQSKFLALGEASYHVPMPAEQPTKDKPLGKKEAAMAAAQHPDTTTSMGELMARRMADNVH